MGHPLPRLFRLVKLTGLCLVALLAVAVVSVVLWKRSDDGKLLNFYASRGLSGYSNAEIERKEIDPVTGWGTITLTDWDGKPLPCRVAYPKEPPPEGGYGCVIANYGIGQQMSFFERLAPLFANRGVIFVMPEQYGRGVRREKVERSLLTKIYEPRKRAARLVAETRMLVDYLCTQPEVDRSRIDYLGISYGGIVGATLLAEEPRFRSATFVMAGGNIPAMLQGLLRHAYPDSRVFAPVLARGSAWWLSAFEPLDHVGKAGTPRMLFLWVEPDDLIPPASRQALVAAATASVTEKTYPGPHSRPPVESVTRMISDALDWMGYPQHSALPASKMMGTSNQSELLLE